MPTQPRQIPGSPEFFTEMQAKAIDAFSAFAQANQHVLQEFVELSASTAKEGVRVYAELQSAMVEAAREEQAPAMGGREGMEELHRNPFAWYQRSLLSAVDGTHKAFKLFEANAQVVTRSAERLQASTEQSGKHVQEALTSYMTRLKEIYGVN